MPETILRTIFQVKRGPSEKWEASSEILRPGEPAFAIDTGEFKIGTGDKTWNQLSPITGGLVLNQIATEEKLGVVKSSKEKNKVLVEADGTMSVNGLADELDSKINKLTDVVPGALIMADETGNLISSEILVSDIINNNLIGSLTEYIIISENGKNVIELPEKIKKCPVINVYHNGLMLVKDVHYSLDTDKIVLLNYTTYSGDIISYVGYDKSSDLVPNDSIEKISIGGILAAIENKTVDIPIGTEEKLGVVKSSREQNKIFIEEDGTMSVTSVDIRNLTIPEGEELILISGTSIRR